MTTFRERQRIDREKRKDEALTTLRSAMLRGDMVHAPTFRKKWKLHATPAIEQIEREALGWEIDHKVVSKYYLNANPPGVKA